MKLRDKGILFYSDIGHFRVSLLLLEDLNFYLASYPCLGPCLHIEIQNITPQVSVVRTQCFHCWGPGSIPGRGTKILQVEQHTPPFPPKITSSNFLERLALFTEGV